MPNYWQNWIYALIAQQAEHIHGKDGVIGSIPIEGSTLKVSQIFGIEVFGRFLRYVAHFKSPGWFRDKVPVPLSFYECTGGKDLYGFFIYSPVYCVINIFYICCIKAQRGICGHEVNAYLNAAKNILAVGLTASACGATVEQHFEAS